MRCVVQGACQSTKVYQVEQPNSGITSGPEEASEILSPYSKIAAQNPNLRMRGDVRFLAMAPPDIATVVRKM
jgi:hypothetical protein